MKRGTTEYLLKILDCISDGIFITDGRGKVLLLNKASEALCKYSRDDMMGRDLDDLIAEGYFSPEEIISTRVITSMKEESLMQKGLNDDHELLVTGVPLIEDGKVEKVIVTERDISHLCKLESELKYNKELNKRYEEELKYLRKLKIGRAHV